MIILYSNSVNKQRETCFGEIWLALQQIDRIYNIKHNKLEQNKDEIKFSWNKIKYKGIFGWNENFTFSGKILLEGTLKTDIKISFNKKQLYLINLITSILFVIGMIFIYMVFKNINNTKYLSLFLTSLECLIVGIYLVGMGIFFPFVMKRYYNLNERELWDIIFQQVCNIEQKK